MNGIASLKIPDDCTGYLCVNTKPSHYFLRTRSQVINKSRTIILDTLWPLTSTAGFEAKQYHSSSFPGFSIDQTFGGALTSPALTLTTSLGSRGTFHQQLASNTCSRRLLRFRICRACTCFYPMLFVVFMFILPDVDLMLFISIIISCKTSSIKIWFVLAAGLSENLTQVVFRQPFVIQHVRTRFLSCETWNFLFYIFFHYHIII